MTPGEWREAVFSRDRFRCSAETHGAACEGQAQEAHHIVYRSHLTKPTMWLVANGISLSFACHILAHCTHNVNISEVRKDEAVDAVNDRTDPTKPELRRPYFYSKGASHAV